MNLSHPQVKAVLLEMKRLRSLEKALDGSDVSRDTLILCMVSQSASRST